MCGTPRRFGSSRLLRTNFRAPREGAQAPEQGACSEPRLEVHTGRKSQDEVLAVTPTRVQGPGKHENSS